MWKIGLYILLGCLFIFLRNVFGMQDCLHKCLPVCTQKFKISCVSWTKRSCSFLLLIQLSCVIWYNKVFFFREKWGYKMINKQAFLCNYRYDFYFYLNSWIWVRAENLHVGITPMLNTSVGNPSGHKYFNVTSISMFLNVRKYVMCRENC